MKTNNFTESTEKNECLETNLTETASQSGGITLETEDTLTLAGYGAAGDSTATPFTLPPDWDGEGFIPVTEIYLDTYDVSLNMGDSCQITATTYPANASNPELAWHSENPDVVSVYDGVIFARGIGTTTIYAVANDYAGIQSEPCTVSVVSGVPVTSIELSTTSAELYMGDSMELHATVYPSNASIREVNFSSPSAEATIEVLGPRSARLTGAYPGTARIIVSAKDSSNCSESCNIKVKPEIYVNGLTIVGDKLQNDCLTLQKGETATITAIVSPQNASYKEVYFTSADPSVATVRRSSGLVKGVFGGETEITATALDGSGITKKIRVVVGNTVTSPVEEEIENKVPDNIVADPVDVYSGAHLLKNTLMSLFGGQRLSLVAEYNSTRLVRGSLGVGWYHNFGKRLEICECEAYVYTSPTVFSTYKWDSQQSYFLCTSADKPGHILTVNETCEYPYVINCNWAKTEYYDIAGRLVKIVDHQGFETLLTYSDDLLTVTDSVSGKHIYLEKNSAGKIVRVYDDAGREATLSYTGDFLTQICDVNGNSLTYTYDTVGRVLTGTDANDVCFFTNTYDTYGRVLTQKDAIEGSLPTRFSYNCGTRTVINRNGKTSSRIYNSLGLLSSYTDENNNTKTYEYDVYYNVLRETDAKGNTVFKLYNYLNKPSQVADKNGNVTLFTYDDKGNVTNIRYPAIDGVVPEETFVYNDRNQMTQHTDIRGTVTLYTYDANGMPATKKVGEKAAVVYSYEAGLLKSETDARGYTTTYTHNALGQVISKTDAKGKVTTYTYDNLGNLLSMTDPCGKTVTYTYDCNNQKTSVTDANANITEYSYNGNMKNDAVTLPDNHTIRYEFDGEDRTTKVIDQANNVTNITYDDGGRIHTKRLPDNATTEYEYDAVGNVVKEINPKGGVTEKTYDKNGNVLTVTDDEGNVTAYEYNAMNKVTKVTNAASGTTVYTYSPAGDLLSETNAFGKTKTYTYDAYGNRLTATDARGNVTTYTYDANNNLLTVKDALNHLTTYTYNELNQCISVKDALNRTIHYGYDAVGRRTTVTDARGNVFTTTYDGNGNVIKTTDAKNNVISETVYNALNHPLTVTDAMGKTTTYTYNALGKVETVTDPMNHCTTFFYNARGQNTSVLDAAYCVSTKAHDLLGNVTRLAGPLGGATAYTYDDMGRLASESTTSGGTKSYEYNALSIRDKITNARGQIRETVYDKMGRPESYTSPEGTVSYTYDENNNVLTVTDSHGTITRTYDELNRVLTCTDTYGKVIRYTYDAVGNLSTLTYPDNTAVTYAYDANHNLVRVTDWANRVTSYTYDENNRVVGVTKPDGSVTTTVYDSKQRVTSTVERTAGGTVISGFEYIYDDMSKIIEEKVLANSTKMCYTYDSLGRVTKRTVKKVSDNSVISEETFAYDAAGNVTEAPECCFQYDTNNRLVVFNENTVTYDLDGNMLFNGAIACTYDSANRLISAGGHTYTYNAEDVRIRNLCSDADTTYTYDVNCELSRLLSKTTNGNTTKYVYGRGLIGEEKCNAFKTYHFDARGSTIALTNEDGNITDTLRYDTYGKLISHIGESFIIFGYNGRDGVVTDKNGLIYMRARYYSPEMKRFVNADIVAGEISNAVTLNRFAYANGNPVSFVDPFGLSPEREDTTEDEIQCGIDEYINLLCQLIAAGSEQYSNISTAEDFADAILLMSGKVKFVKKGDYIIVKGNRDILSEYGIKQTRIRADNVKKFKGIDDLLGSQSFKNAFKNSFDAPGVIIDAVGVVANTIYEVNQYESTEDKVIVGTYTATTEVVSTVASAAASAGATALATKIGAAAGTAIAPGVGTAIGIAAGFVVGIALDGLFGWIRKEYIEDIVENN